MTIFLSEKDTESLLTTLYEAEHNKYMVPL